MATRQLSLRPVLELRRDTSDSPGTTKDDTFTLDGFDNLTEKKYSLAAAGADVIITWASCYAVEIRSLDYPFYYRLKTGETLVGPVMYCCPGIAPDMDAAIASTSSILLTGNGDHLAELEITIIES